MDLTPYIETIHRQLEASAEAGGEEATALIDRLLGPLDSSIRLSLQDALSAAADEITVELAPGSVELRLRGRDPEFVVTPPPADPSSEDADRGESESFAERARAPEGDEGPPSRINLRLPEQLKARIERAASDEGLSVNSWLVRAASSGLERTNPPWRRGRHTPLGSQHYTGWAR